MECIKLPKWNLFLYFKRWGIYRQKENGSSQVGNFPYLRPSLLIPISSPPKLLNKTLQFDFSLSCINNLTDDIRRIYIPDCIPAIRRGGKI